MHACKEIPTGSHSDNKYHYHTTINKTKNVLANTKTSQGMHRTSQLQGGFKKHQHKEGSAMGGS